MEFSSAAALHDAVGTHLGFSDWVAITQERIDTFADATGDHQWIHVDPDRARHGPFGTTIAHGYLTLSITNQFLPELLRVPSAKLGVNYGANKVRFPAPVPVGSRIRAHATVNSAERKPIGVLYNLAVTVEVEGQEKPALVGDVLFIAG